MKLLDAMRSVSKTCQKMKMRHFKLFFVYFFNKAIRAGKIGGKFENFSETINPARKIFNFGIESR